MGLGFRVQVTASVDVRTDALIQARVGVRVGVRARVGVGVRVRVRVIGLAPGDGAHVADCRKASLVLTPTPTPPRSPSSASPPTLG